MNCRPTIFVDGAEGTTGLLIRERLAQTPDIQILEIDPASRKDPGARSALLNSADIAILCLPDTAARESVSLVANPSTRVIDASTAHRTAPGWVYGLPELQPSQRKAIAEANRVSVPGCHATGFILAVRPLVEAGFIDPAQTLVTVSLTGYTGGGRQLIQKFESDTGDRLGACPYALNLAHKHLPEMMHHSGLQRPPMFQPVVGRFARGMIVSVFLGAAKLLKPATIEVLHEVCASRYQTEKAVNIVPPNSSFALNDGMLLATGCNHTNRVDIFIAGNDDQPVVHARLDNLGKGASGAALQCLNLMLGRSEFDSLTL